MTPDSVARQQTKLYRRKGAKNYPGDFTEELFGSFNAVSGGDTTVAPAVAGSKIRVLSYSLSCVAAGVATVGFYSNPSVGADAVSPTISLAANQFVAESSEIGLFETFAGESLVVAVATNNVGIRLTYIYVD